MKFFKICEILSLTPRLCSSNDKYALTWTTGLGFSDSPFLKPVALLFGELSRVCLPFLVRNKRLRCKFQIPLTASEISEVFERRYVKLHTLNLALTCRIVVCTRFQIKH